MAAARKKIAENEATNAEPVAGSRSLAEGDSGPDVEVVQALVLTPVTGDYDAVTTKAVKVWQKNRGLTPTGLIGDSDWKRVFIDTAPSEA